MSLNLGWNGYYFNLLNFGIVCFKKLDCHFMYSPVSYDYDLYTHGETEILRHGDFISVTTVTLML